MLGSLVVIVFSNLSLASHASAAQDLQCSELVARLSPVDSYRGDKIPTPAQQQTAINALKEIPPDRYTSVPEIRKEIQADFAAALLKFYSSRRNCEKTRIHLIGMLTKYATQPKLAKSEREATLELIRTELGRATFPTFETMDLKIGALEDAFTKKIFDAKKTKESRAALQKLLKSESDRLNSLSNSMQPENLQVNLEKDSLADVRKEFSKAQNKKEVANRKGYQLAELEAVERLDALYSKILVNAR